MKMVEKPVFFVHLYGRFGVMWKSFGREKGGCCFGGEWVGVVVDGFGSILDCIKVVLILNHNICVRFHTL